MDKSKKRSEKNSKKDNRSSKATKEGSATGNKEEHEQNRLAVRDVDDIGSNPDDVDGTSKTRAKGMDA